MFGDNRALTNNYENTVVVAQGSRRVLYGVVGATFFAGLTFVGANIYIPLIPVPVTMQTLFVLLGGAVLRGRYGALGQIVYVGLGALGLPVFATHVGGLGILAGPTGGYLYAFLVAPLLVAALLGRSWSIAWQASVFAAGTLVIFAFGVAHLTLFYTHDLAAALRVGALPFIPGEVFKIVAAVSIYRSYRALRRRNPRH